MPNYWFFQSNPERYDIDGALRELETIRWRVPQHTAAIRAGDKVAIWRSGEQAGLIGAGIVLEPPRELDSPPEEARFYRQEEPDATDLRTTRAPIRVQPVNFVPKSRIAAIPELAEHQIVIAPMGTVFPINDTQWQALVGIVPELERIMEAPEPASEVQEWPRPFSWQDRRKSVYPLPGGYDQYLHSLCQLLEHTDELRPERDSLEEWISGHLGTSRTSARYAVDFLQRISLVSAQANRVELTPEARHWLETSDSAFLVALLHSRVRFIGELLKLLDEPASPDALLERANELYGMGWKSRAQIDRRRGWLESAGMLVTDEQNRWTRTEAGDSLLRRLRVEPPREIPPDSRRPGPKDKPPSEIAVTLPDVVPSELEDTFGEALRLETRLRETSVDTTDPTLFEKAAAEAFAFLGFRSSWLGGSGKTDVLLVADLAPDEAYRVIVDCKTTGRDAVQDHQIDWVTLREHREQHQADFIVVMAPAFAGTRVFERAGREDWRALLLDVERMGSLLRQHARVPLDLATYREFFAAKTAEAGAQKLAEAVEELDRRLQLSARICRLISRYQSAEGALQPRDLYWLLQDFEDEVGGYTREEIAESLAALSSPAIPLLRQRDGGFVDLGSTDTAARRLRLLAGLLTDMKEDRD